MKIIMSHDFHPMKSFIYRKMSWDILHKEKKKKKNYLDKRNWDPVEADEGLEEDSRETV